MVVVGDDGLRPDGFQLTLAFTSGVIRPPAGAPPSPTSVMYVVILLGVFVAVRFQQGKEASPTPSHPSFSPRALYRPWQFNFSERYVRRYHETKYNH
ncbi:hypothetical protein DPMN_009417 [Dreissena polymorpha]|uniref:Uncharacterized protein n=1 Tax=Dreissena polymorpha TaxID=45954 RepID=A0A9D4N173_DREPO|nr:hypothetical protein DPMN_009417 [Dreissena polymorpha]